MDSYKALTIAIKAHKDQKDKAGLPYINHPVAVASMVSSEDEKVVALLHDVLEDSAYTIEDLLKDGLSSKQAEALMLLTHDASEDYLLYITKIKNNPLAKAVKKADLLHNMDLSRLNNITKKDIDRQNKYKIAYQILSK